MALLSMGPRHITAWSSETRFPMLIVLSPYAGIGPILSPIVDGWTPWTPIMIGTLGP
jgi:hypothetical protein